MKARVGVVSVRQIVTQSHYLAGVPLGDRPTLWAFSGCDREFRQGQTGSDGVRQGQDLSRSWP
ncbi:hypothetical protein FRAAL2655 [Frankia alni ACN14a]|uniref:Uncharacterized protein n=1 Tax=Frankia alni (strain DSM 45986 / CECT 9034 / ACN14a) TaxID=326424 RepID=Q0RMF0_FRAAA|nr:hypothetical protein FRAAL2655 [Frankia alni ACN14a]